MAKTERLSVTLVVDHGVEGDVHAGATVRHVVDARRQPDRPNLRQVHLLGAEALDELRAAGHDVAVGAVGENVLTRGLDLGALPLGTELRLGDDAVVALTGLRTPCRQLEGVQPGLLAAALERHGGAPPRPRIGVMAVVVAGGEVRAGDPIAVVLPVEPHAPLPVL
jgi:MOSC domain-containing protein YiiM